MASSSSVASDSQPSPQWKYDVFLSFRGEDTRNTFTSHLYKELTNMRINTFQDDKSLQVGDFISKELLEAIEKSQVALIIFSKNYATSGWCLSELVKIMECKERNGQIVIPIFHDVDPSDVRKQKESFAKAFAEHESNYKNDVERMQKVQGWRTALTAATNLKGHDIRNKIESEKIQEIVDDISSICKSARSSYFLQDVVGIKAHLENLKSLLQIEINNVRVLGIWGVGGIGKTTIANALFHILSYQFKGACFLADVRENAGKNGLHSLQNILLSELLRKKDDYVNNKHQGKSVIPNRLSKMKVLIVLDDIDDADQLEHLAGDVGWFDNGSRVIVTTRDQHLIKKCDAIYKLPILPDHEAMHLFNKHAFIKEVPDECFKELSLEVVDHAKGLPLALKVWGSFLYKRNITEWRSAIEKMKTTSNSEIVEKLKISYDGLDDTEKNIFLDIACFFRGYEKDEVMPILESCYFGADIGLSVLIDKSLVFVSKYDTIQMHDLIEDMGKYIVNMQKNPGERSRLWDVEDIEEVMVNNTGTNMAVEAIWAPYKQLWFRKEAMKNMPRLRMLRINWYTDSEDVVFIEYLSNRLRCLVFNDYPLKSLPQNFNAAGLVHLELKNSSLHYLWNETKHLPHLRSLDLSESPHLKRTPDFTGMPNLEYLNLRECENLEEVHHSLGCSRKLVELDLSACESLKSFPYVNMESLNSLHLNDCSSLQKLPEFRTELNLEIEIMKLNLEIEIADRNIHLQPHLKELDWSGIDVLVALPSFICKLKCLVKLDVSRCLKLESLPEKIADLENLEVLDASNTLISRPPSSIIRLNKLKVLTFSKKESEDGAHFVFPEVNEGLLSLEQLDLSCCNLTDGGLPEDIGCLSSLKVLNLCGNNFEHLPRSLAQLGALQSLDLSWCGKLKEFPDFTGILNLEIKILYHKIHLQPHLKELDLGGIVTLVAFPSFICKLKCLVKLDVSGCLKIECLPEEIADLENLKVLDASDTLISQPPSSIIRLNKLKVLTFAKEESEDGAHFVFPEVNEGLLSLEQLDLSFCNITDGGLPEDIGSLFSLKKLNLCGNNFEHLPRSIAQLGALQSLDLSWCGKLKEFPDFTGMPNLEYLDLRECESLEEVHHSLGCSRKLVELDLSACESLKSFPYVNVESLKSLNLEDCSSLQKLPEFRTELNLEIEIMKLNLEIEIGDRYIHLQPHLTELDWSGIDILVALPSFICKLKCLVKLDVSCCSKLESLPEEIVDLQNLEVLDASNTLISRPPSSIIRLNKLKVLTFGKKRSGDGAHFVFPEVNEGLLSLEQLDLSYCNITDGGLPEDIGSLFSLKVLNLRGNNFEHLPQSIAQLGALRSLDLSDCERLTQLPEFPQQLDRINADWDNDSICNSLFQNISSLQHAISASDSLSLRVFTSQSWDIPSWFHHQGMGRINLPENWYVSDNFLGFAVCYSGKLMDDITADLIPLCNHGTSWMTQKFSLSKHNSEYYYLHFLFVPRAGLWDESKANGKTPNDYGCIKLSFSKQLQCGVRLLYKNEAELQTGMRRSRDEEGSCSSSKKQRSLLQLFPTSPGI